MANHASHASLPYPIKNARYTILVPYLDADGDPTDPTTPDTEFSGDDGAAADTAEEVSSPKNSVGMLTLTGAETNYSCVSLAGKAASGPKTTLATLYPRNLPILESGTASAGASGTITLASGTYTGLNLTGCFIRTTGGTGGGGTGGANNQCRRITSYNTSTRVATVTPNWETTPSSDTTYDVLLPEGVLVSMLTALAPTTLARTLDVSAGGEAGIDWANVGSPTTTLNLSGTTVKTATDVETDTADIQSRLPAALGANGNIKADVRDYNGTAGTFSAGRPEVNTTHAAGTAWNSGAIGASTLASDTITAAKIAADAITDAKVASDVTIASVTGSVGSVATGGITASSIADGAIDRATFAVDTGLQTVRSNTAQAGGATTITLDASASATDDIYNYHLILLTGGTGAGQARYITDYVGSTKVATVASWQTNPDATTTFAILPGGQIPGATAPTAGEVADAVWDEARSGHVTAGTFGEYSPANVTHFGGTAGTFSGGRAEVNTSHAAGTAWGSGAITAASIATGAITAAKFAAGAIDAAALAADAGTEIGTAVWATTTRILTALDEDTTTLDLDATIRAAVGLASANLDTQFDGVPTDIRTELATELARIDVATSTRMATYAQPTGFLAATFPTTVASPTNITAGTITTVMNLTNLPAITSNWLTAAGLATDAVTEIVNAVLTTAMTESYNTDGSPPTVAQAFHVIMQMLTEMTISGTTMTVKKLDGSTTAFTLTLNNSTTPTAVTRAT